MGVWGIDFLSGVVY